LKGVQIMLLAIDIGNSNISVGLFDGERELKFLSSIDTDGRKTADQISIDLMNIFTLYHYDIRDVTGAIFSSVVPSMDFMMSKALTRLLGRTPMEVGPGIRTGLNIRMENHNQLGADLVANAVSALVKYRAPIILIDMGTATTISYISSKRTYEGGLMFPGVYLSLDALSRHAAQLPDVSLQHPKNLIGKNTEDCMRNGIVYGMAGMLDGIVDRIRDMLKGEEPTVVATGTPAPVIVRHCRNQIIYDKYLLMEGLWEIYQRNT
jgi:type III pantothenate kinase